MFFSWGLNQKEAWDHPAQFTFPNRWFDLGSTLPCRSPDPPSPSERSGVWPVARFSVFRVFPWRNLPHKQGSFIGDWFFVGAC